MTLKETKNSIVTHVRKYKAAYAVAAVVVGTALVRRHVTKNVGEVVDEVVDEHRPVFDSTLSAALKASGDFDYEQFEQARYEVRTALRDLVSADSKGKWSIDWTYNIVQDGLSKTIDDTEEAIA